MEVTLKNVVLRFENVFNAKAVNNGNPRYSATFLVPKGSETANTITKVISDLATEKWKDKGAAIVKKCMGSSLSSAWVDGELKADYSGFEGMMSLTANRNETQGRPVVVDRRGQPVSVDDQLIYPGVTVIAKVDIYMQDHPDYGKGVRCSLLGIQYVKAGTPFTAGGAKATFEALEDDEEEDSLV